MTATAVNGVAVAADEPTRAPIRARGGKEIFWPKVRTLTLVDGSTIYGCQHCDYVNENVLSIRPHLKKHAPKQEKVHRILPPCRPPHPLVAVVAAERKRRGITISRLFRLTGFHRTTLRGWELGRRIPDVESLAKYASAVGLELVLVRSQRQPAMDGQGSLFERQAS